MTADKLTGAINEAKRKGGCAFVPYIMAGDGGLGRLEQQVLFLQEAGATAVELGIPFSDPAADGPVIQQAGIRALEEGVTLGNVIRTVAGFSDEVRIPVILMTYLNPVLSHGVATFANDCLEAGIAGVIVPDVPFEESAILEDALRMVDVAFIRLVPLSAPEDRIRAIAGAAEGFIYAVTVDGITGARDSFGGSSAERLRRLKEIADVPVLAGFGISSAEHVREFGRAADGVIVGSAIVDALHRDDLVSISGLIRAAREIAVPAE
ncbi:tryptophan synthase subunit alpha [Bhargavaea ullalensis]|uniref:Tryptophan synthase alpha chain n=1 Tax=Bhargavaea ullalensis TaxID=1265685 RepID=A0ABV2G766_9BACL